MRAARKTVARVITPPGARLALHATLAACVLLVPIQLGWVSRFRYAWGYTLWQYLPAGVPIVLAGALFLLCWPLPRRSLIRGFTRIHERLQSPQLWAVKWAGLVLGGLLLWVARERVFLGDSTIFLYVMATAHSRFIFPDIGGTYLLYGSHDLGKLLGVGGLNGAQAYVCACGVLALICFGKVGRYLAPTPKRAAFATTLILCGGVTRIFAGHIEVYSALLVCVGAYLWAALACLQGRCRWRVPAVLLGLGLWTHLSFLFLVPSLLVLSILEEPERPWRSRGVQWITGSAIVAAPIICFFLLIWLSGQGAELVKVWDKLVLWSTVGPNPDHEAWIRPWGEPGPGTRYVLLSWPHLTYLANAFFMLAPAAIPVLTAFAVGSPRRLFSSPQTVFLSTACAAMVIYAIIVRPVFGPYDWDLFCVTAVCLTALAAHLLTNDLETDALAHLGIVFVGATLLFVTIPLLVIGVAPGNHVGPFTIRAGTLEAFEQKLAPWL